MKPFILLVLAVLLAGACTCCADHSIPTTIGPGKTESKNPGKKPGNHNANLPVMGACQTLKVPFKEMSGLCMNQDTTGFWSVSDEGALCRISFSGSVTPVLRTNLDFEGITIDPATGDLFVVVEGDQMVCHVAAPDYNVLDTLFYVAEAVQRDFDNNGLEGIAWYKEDMFFVGSQEDALVWLYKTDGTLVRRVSLCGETSLIEETAGLFYDATKDWLWVADSDAAKIFVFKAGDFELVTCYDVSFIDNAESICVDRAHDCVWVGSDEDEPFLYRISFSF